MTSLPAHRAERKRLGAWYTPAGIVRPLVDWAIRSSEDRVLDPAAGDGGFLLEASLRLRSLGCQRRDVHLYGFDLNPRAISATEALLAAEGIASQGVELRHADFFTIEPPDGRGSPVPSLDVVTGNPPYIRYQSFTGASRAAALARAEAAGVHLTGLSSSWAAFVVHAAGFLRTGGRLALVLPEELLHASYAGAVRGFLRRSFRSTAVVLLEDYAFPDSQEGVVLLCASGKDERPSGELVLTRVGSPEDIEDLESVIRRGETLPPDENPEKWRVDRRNAGARVLDRLAASESFVALRSFGKAGIGYVSGANGFFVLRPSEAKQRGFPKAVLRPTLVAAKQIPGAVFSHEDLRDLVARDEPCLLWDGGGAGRPAVARYIREGESRGIDERYKCRMRNPWYRVPGVAVPEAFLTYMSDEVPRLVLNREGVTCSNNFLAIRWQGLEKALGPMLIAAFYNSATMLSGEDAGRHYGGGVLKLEPKEADRVLIPAPAVIRGKQRELSALLKTVDRLLRERRAAEALKQVDNLILREVCGLGLAEIESIRQSLANRQRARKGKRSLRRPVLHVLPSVR